MDSDAPHPEEPSGRTCRWCGEGYHRICPYIKALEFSAANGRITRVEYLTAADFQSGKEEVAAAMPASSYPKLKDAS